MKALSSDKSPIYRRTHFCYKACRNFITDMFASLMAVLQQKFSSKAARFVTGGKHRVIKKTQNMMFNQRKGFFQVRLLLKNESAYHLFAH